MAEKIARMPVESMRFCKSYADEGGRRRQRGNFQRAADTCSTAFRRPGPRPEFLKPLLDMGAWIFTRCALKSTTALKLLRRESKNCRSSLSLSLIICLVFCCCCCVCATHSRYARIIGEDSCVGIVLPESSRCTMPLFWWDALQRGVHSRRMSTHHSTKPAKLNGKQLFFPAATDNLELAHVVRRESALFVQVSPPHSIGTNSNTRTYRD